MVVFFMIVGVITIFLLIKANGDEKERLSKMTPAELRADRKLKELQYLEASRGKRNAALHCPHCQTSGMVHTKNVKGKKGIHGGKATAAILTGGVTLLATGLSRKEANTEAFCANCKSIWHF